MTRRAGRTITTNASDATTGDAIETRVVAVAEQLGRIVGTVQAKAAGLLPTKKKTTKPPDRSPRRAQGRSGGMVDAPGKKHRKPVQSDPKAKTAQTRAAGTRTAKAPVNVNRRRGRG